MPDFCTHWQCSPDRGHPACIMAMLKPKEYAGSPKRPKGNCGCDARSPVGITIESG